MQERTEYFVYESVKLFLVYPNVCLGTVWCMKHILSKWTQYMSIRQYSISLKRRTRLKKVKMEDGDEDIIVTSNR